MINNNQETPVFYHPLPAAKFQDIVKDIQSLVKVWVKMFMPEEVPLKDNNYLEVIPKLPLNYQELLTKILIMKCPCICNIIELRSNSIIYIQLLGELHKIMITQEGKSSFLMNPITPIGTKYYK